MMRFLIISLLLSVSLATDAADRFVDCRYGRIKVTDDCFFLDKFLPFITGSDGCLQESVMAEHDEIFFDIVYAADGSVAEILYNHLLDAIMNHPGFISRVGQCDRKMKAVNDIIEGEAVMSGQEDDESILNFKKNFKDRVKPCLTTRECELLDSILQLK
jgi:hypothetical protein